MKIAHWKRTQIAMAPDAIVECINKYTDHKSVLYNNTNNFDKDIDVIHFHNQFIPNNYKSVIQYHSPPNYVNHNFSGTKLVIAQYHALLHEYYDCDVVRNVIDFLGKDNIYQKGINRWNDNDNIIRIVYSPSRTTNTDKWHDKGYKETAPILKRISERFKNVEIDIIGNPPIPHKDCLQRKTQADIVIDECKTNSYHRSGLEGLAMGKLTICSLDEDVSKLLKIVSESDVVPFHNVWIDTLESFLIKTIEKGREYIIEEGKKSRKWMEKHWHPKDITNEFIDIYKNI